MAVRERRRSHQSHPQDKANYLVIGVLFIVLCILLLKNWPDNLAREAFTLAGPIVGGLINYLTTRANAQTDTAVNTGSVENMTVKADPASEFRDEARQGDTEELTLEKRRRLGIP